VPKPWQARRQLHVGGQQALAGARLLRGDGPVAGVAAAGQAQRAQLCRDVVQLAQARELAGQADAFELVGFALRQRFIG
nr:hypothetical protein [Tanacetum cinerariifolium]